MRIEPAEDGGLTSYYFRQSWLNDWLKCPAKAVWDEMAGGTPPSTATAIGTAMHAGIAADLLGETQRQIVTAMSEAWEEEASKPGFRRDRTTSDLDAIKMAGAAYKAWTKDIRPTLDLNDIQSIERTFEVVVDERADPNRDGHVQRLVLKGTWDAMIAGTLWDWKSASNPEAYYAGNVERAVQPTCYTLAAWLLGEADLQPVRFNYGIVYKRKTISCPTDVVTAYRGVHDWTWLVTLMWDVVDSWDHPPLMPNGWWCSAKWCEHWGICRGAPRAVPALWAAR